MKKKDAKQINELASKLPEVRYQFINGYLQNEDGSFVPNIEERAANHSRRLKNAYKNFGIEGIKRYLDAIRQLQEKRRQDAGLSNTEGEIIDRQAGADSKSN